MLLRIAAIERMIPTLRGPAADTCDNRAPEARKLIAPCDLDLDAVEASLAILEAWPAPPPITATQAMEAAAQLDWFAERIKADVTRQADVFGLKALKPAGLVGKTDVRLLFYYVFADRLLAVAHAAFDWLYGPARDLEFPARLKMAADIGAEEIKLPRLISSNESAITLTQSINHSTDGSPARWPIISRAHSSKTHLAREQVTP